MKIIKIPYYPTSSRRWYKISIKILRQWECLDLITSNTRIKQDFLFLSDLDYSNVKEFLKYHNKKVEFIEVQQRIIKFSVIEMMKRYSQEPKFTINQTLSSLSTTWATSRTISSRFETYNW